ncbi:membrane-spanning 4-domains subfamily A member 4D-like isoform X2 [Siniperca chuatsi]|uniref:membrane-spanning 4-domains subfamily A member 4D-like isoform X2 n=1 Tax=Siniperca chuatsi TaxID=119488 RepID=UPI001CE120EE|nr:membrane-spanning 4-domains subfamily A member 4D-like isoform X2 [Siniperca chuatsi]
MSSSLSTTAGSVVVVTHVHPVPQGAGHQLCVGTQKFSKGRPLVLGTVQIMIGLMVLLFGIAMAINADTLGVYSGIFMWGALCYITAGSLTVAAGKSFNRCLVNGALAVSVAAAVVSCTATILYALDATGLMIQCYGSDSWKNYCYPYVIRMQGVSGVLAVFHLLELIVSVTVTGFACNATCNCNTEKPSIVVVPGDVSVTAHDLPNSQAPSVSLAQLPSQMVSYSKNREGQTDPPAYSA